MRRSNLTPMLCLALAFYAPVTIADNGQETPKVESGLIERTGVSLLLLDVVVADEKGKPLPGLEAADFTIELDGRQWEIHSLDDFCPPEQAPNAEIPPSAESASSAARETGPSSNTPRLPQQEAVRFALYLDFSQLRQEGRLRALNAAKQWVREVMKAEQEAKVVAYGYNVGLKELSPFTADKQVLLSAIDEAETDIELLDPFPADLPNRLEACCVRCGNMALPVCCKQCCPTGYSLCDGYAWDEFVRSRASLRSLRDFLERMEAVPGRKALVVFQQNATYVPSRFYSIPVGDHITLLDEVAAEATLSRTSIHTAFPGDAAEVTFPWITGLPVNLGANLADFTGGSYNRGVADLDSLVAGAGREADCLYRIGLLPPEEAGNHVFRVRVSVHDRVLPGRYRVRVIDKAERWWRTARSVLSDPEQVREIDVTASLVPVRASRGRWDVKVQVALDSDSLFLAPSGEVRTGNWEVGAMLADEDARDTWEMFSVSELRRRGLEGQAVTILHEREFQGLRPGKYELRTFVRDRWQNVYGGAKATIALPRPDTMGVVAPSSVRTPIRYMSAALPMRGRESTVESSKSAKIEVGPLPAGRRPVRIGEPTEFHSWVCAGEEETEALEVRRFVSHDGEIHVRFTEPGVIPANECSLLVDLLDTSAMEIGRYVYELRLDRQAGTEPQSVGVSFELTTASVDRAQDSTENAEIVPLPEPSGSEAVETATVASTTPGPANSPASSDPEFDANDEEELNELLDKLSTRAALHVSLLYEFHCIEKVTREVYRFESMNEPRLLHKRTRHASHGLVVTKGADGQPRASRQELDADDQPVRGPDGIPAEARLSRPFRPITGMIPQAAVSWFTPDRWNQLTFNRVEHLPGNKACPEPEHVVLEFLDREGPRKTKKGCSATASGRMCVDPAIGEVSLIQFYGLYRRTGGCSWDLESPLAIIEQQVQDSEAGVRFPSRTRTVYHTEQGEQSSVQEFAVFTQRFEDCVFPDVRVQQGL